MNAAEMQGEELMLVPGVRALAPGFAYIEATQTLITADTHFGYEEAIGSALPAWSTADMLAALLRAIRRSEARELVILGDVVHSPRMSEGMAERIRDALAQLRNACELRLIAGNHEGRGRAREILGETDDLVQRDGWTLVHGDVVAAAERTIIGHIHPSLSLDGRKSVPAFLASPSLIVVPALTPYSPGLSAISAECLRAIARFGVKSFRNVRLTACTPQRLYAFGSVAAMHGALSRAEDEDDRSPFRRRVLRPDR